jgi:predicted RNA binding protein YcfA (HicA-like mRNA interferase family)
MRKQVTFKQLEQFLLDIGFVSVPTAGKHKVFEHETSGAVILLPLTMPDDPVEPVRLASIRNVIVGKGVLDGNSPEELFDTLLVEV